jgi:hypothetical protein
MFGLTENWYDAERKNFKVAFSLKLKKGLWVIIFAPSLYHPFGKIKWGEGVLSHTWSFSKYYIFGFL